MKTKIGNCIFVLLACLAEGCSDPGKHACSKDDVVEIVKNHARESFSTEMLGQMMATGIEDSAKKARDPNADISGKTKLDISIDNIRTEQFDRNAKVVKCSALVNRQYYVEYDSGQRQNRNTISSKIGYTIEIADNGNLTVTDFTLP